MRTYLISYDLAKPHVNKHVVAQAIMDLGQGWARPLEQTWYVRSIEGETVLEAKLAGLLDSEDGLLIQAVDDDVLLTNTQLRWFRKRQSMTGEGLATNVIAFPVPAKAAPDQSELPFAQAS